MSEKQPLYNHTPEEESETKDPSTTSQPQHSMNAATENYMSRYNSTIMAQYPDGTSSSSYHGPLPHPIAGWDPQSPTYREMHSNSYYNSEHPMISQHDAPNMPYTPPYARWATQAPVQLNVPTQQMTPPGSDYYPPRHSSGTYRPPGEPGPSRTTRAAHRRSAQDLSLNMPQADGSSGDPSEYSPTPPPSSKRSQTSATKPPSTGELKSFSCTLCTATFTRKGDCLRHRRSVHTRETPYDCQGCGERFSRSDMRGKHWKADPGCESAHWREVCRAMGKESLVDDI